jgi:hypothetical protein
MNRFRFDRLIAPLAMLALTLAFCLAIFATNRGQPADNQTASYSKSMNYSNAMTCHNDGVYVPANPAAGAIPQLVDGEINDPGLVPIRNHMATFMVARFDGEPVLLTQTIYTDDQARGMDMSFTPFGRGYNLRI